MTDTELKQLLAEEKAINEKIEKLTSKARKTFGSKVADFKAIAHLNCMYRDVDTPSYSDSSWYTIESSIDRTAKHKYIHLVNNWMVDNVYTSNRSCSIEEIVTGWSRKTFFAWVFRHSNFSALVKRGFTSIKKLKADLKELYGERKETEEDKWF